MFTERPFYGLRGIVLLERWKAMRSPQQPSVRSERAIEMMDDALAAHLPATC